MDATFTRDGKLYRLTAERQLDHPPEKVWRAITERELVKQWFPADVEGEWKVGAPLRFIFLHGQGEGLTEEELSGEVLIVDPPRVLEFLWGKFAIRCEIEATGDGSLFRISEAHDDPSMGARNAAGWEMCLENLELVVQGGTIAKFAWGIWKAKFERYKAKFEPEHGPQQDAPESFQPDDDEESS